MYGPRPRGFWSATLDSSASSGVRSLVVGARHRVIRPFVDFDGDAHPWGETWIFLGSAFAPRDDGVSLFVSFDGEDEWHIRMMWTDDQQGPVLDAFESYVTRTALD